MLSSLDFYKTLKHLKLLNNLNKKIPYVIVRHLDTFFQTITKHLQFDIMRLPFMNKKRKQKQILFN